MLHVNVEVIQCASCPDGGGQFKMDLVLPFVPFVGMYFDFAPEPDTWEGPNIELVENVYYETQSRMISITFKEKLLSDKSVRFEDVKRQYLAMGFCYWNSGKWEPRQSRTIKGRRMIRRGQLKLRLKKD